MTKELLGVSLFAALAAMLFLLYFKNNSRSPSASSHPGS